MKIIGEATEHFIVEISKDELAELCGYYGKWSYPTKDSVPQVGKEYNINAMYTQLYGLAQNQGKLHNIANELRAVATLLETKNIEMPTIKVPG